jgi:hypothetical protein
VSAVEANAPDRDPVLPDGKPSLRILVVLRALNMDRITEGFLRCALQAGHTVRVALEQSKIGATVKDGNLFEVLAGEYDRFSFDTLPQRRERWLYPATKLRCAIDYVRYFEPEFAGAEILRDRARSRAPWYMRPMGKLGLLRIGVVRRAVDRILRALERRMPLSGQSLELMRAFKPDVVAVSPLVETGSPQGDHLRAADALGIPTVLPVASWDNLTTKGVIRDQPDTTIVWNEDQIREAVEMHGLPRESLVATGAHSHDHWFAWEPSTSREEFAAKVGLRADRPFLLYVCSSGFIAGDDEVAFVREWAQRLAESGDPDLQGLGVLVRPHPQNFRSWAEADLGEPDRIVVFPRGGVAPTDDRSKQDYFDSLHHATAVVGINTTALVDSAIVRRPVFTMVHERFRSTQTGTLHFSYLARSGSGLLNVAQSWDEHFDQLGAAMRSPNGHREQIDSFLRAFIRPQGLDRPAAPLTVEAIERTATLEKEPRPKRSIGRAIVGAWAGALGAWHAMLLPVGARMSPRALAKSRQRLAKRLRKRAKGKRSTEKAIASPDVATPAAVKSTIPKDRAAKEADRAAKEAARAAKEEARAAKAGR